MNFETISHGFIDRRKPTAENPALSGPRLVLANNGTLVCVFMMQSKLGINDFIPVLSRSRDNGLSWRDEGPLWPSKIGKFSFFVALSKDAAGNLFVFGSRYPIDNPGESFWSEETQGLKQNELIWAISSDHGKSWSQPTVIPMPIPGSAEAPGPMIITRAGTMVAPYSPYNTFDPTVKVDRGQVVAMVSRDRGRTWTHTSMIRFAEPNSGAAEAWCYELSDGRLLGTTWHTDYTTGDARREHPNKYALSRDGGVTWNPTRSTGTMGHTTALAALPNGQALFIYVKRKPAEDVGIWAVVAAPTDKDFGIKHQQRIWSVEKPTQKEGAAATHESWTGFNFGEPAAVVLPNDEILVAYWFIANEFSGIGTVRLRLVK